MQSREKNKHQGDAFGACRQNEQYTKFKNIQSYSHDKVANSFLGLRKISDFVEEGTDKCSMSVCEQQTES